MGKKHIRGRKKENPKDTKEQIENKISKIIEEQEEEFSERGEGV